MVFQNLDNQMVTTIVEEDVAFGLENLGIEPAEIRRRVDEAFASVRMGTARRTRRTPFWRPEAARRHRGDPGHAARGHHTDEPTAMLTLPAGMGTFSDTVRRLNRSGVSPCWL